MLNVRPCNQETIRLSLSCSRIERDIKIQPYEHLGRLLFVQWGTRFARAAGVGEGSRLSPLDVAEIPPRLRPRGSWVHEESFAGFEVGAPASALIGNGSKVGVSAWHG